MRSQEFRWNPWNLDKIAQHNVSSADVEHVVRTARAPYPMQIDNGKRLVWGQANDGTYLQVIYLLDEDGAAFVIHARPLTRTEKRRLRRGRR